MSTTNQFDWADFYKEFAVILRSYKSRRPELIEKVRQIYEITGINLPTLEKDNQIVDIDPFTVFGLFNKSKMREDNREKILSAVAELFSVSASVPKAFFVPVLNNQNATFYYFLGQRAEGDIDELWELFDAALDYSENPAVDNRSRFSQYFDLAIQKKGNGNSKITMGLFWISPDTFLNLDQRNTWYIYESGKIPAAIAQTLPAIEAKIPAYKYLDVTEKLRTYLQSDGSDIKDFKELSYEAWRYSEQVNQEKKQEERTTKGADVASEDVETTHYWLYSPGDGAEIWDECCSKGIMAIGWDSIGDFREYSSKDEMKQAMKDKIDPSSSHKNGAHATWQFLNEMKPGDVVFAKKGMKLIVGRGVVESDYEFDTSRQHYKSIRHVKWTHKGEWPHPGQAAMKTLTDITAYTDYVEKLNELFKSDTINDVEEKEINYPYYDAEDFLDEVFMDEDRYWRLVGLVNAKKNIILQGAPGVGKTYAAEKLAYSLMGTKNRDRVKMIQFHQSYSYEDFIVGLRPVTSGEYKIKYGPFYTFCKEAEIDSDNKYFFIIDEINRGNISKIFGELFMLIESDKRKKKKLQLLYSDEYFSVPENVYIIGMMNTADRSLAMLDYALRRRFAFFEMEPGFQTEGFRAYQNSLASIKFDRLIDCVEELNHAISEDDSLGEGFRIGHSYFCGLTNVTDQILSNIVDYELIPLLKEYWFDESGTVDEWAEKLRRAIK